jgi:hypothetical protein
VRPSSSCALVCTENVYLVDKVPVRLLHVLEADIAQDAGVVNEHVNAPKGIDRSLDNLVAILDRVVIGDRVTTCGFDLLDNLIGGLEV